jgi:hypothetical protein
LSANPAGHLDKLDERHCVLVTPSSLVEEVAPRPSRNHRKPRWNSTMLVEPVETNRNDG